MHYVMMSRVTSLKGLHVLNFDPQEILYDKDVSDELKRLQSLENQPDYLRPKIAELKGSSIVYHNVQKSVRAKLPHIKAERTSCHHQS